MTTNVNRQNLGCFWLAILLLALASVCWIAPRTEATVEERRACYAAGNVMVKSEHGWTCMEG